MWESAFQMRWQKEFSKFEISIKAETFGFAILKRKDRFSIANFQILPAKCHDFTALNLEVHWDEVLNLAPLCRRNLGITPLFAAFSPRLLTVLTANPPKIVHFTRPLSICYCLYPSTSQFIQLFHHYHWRALFSAFSMVFFQSETL